MTKDHEMTDINKLKSSIEKPNLSLRGETVMLLKILKMMYSKPSRPSMKAESELLRKLMASGSRTHG